MDMEEFLLAYKEDDLISQIRYCFENDSPMPGLLHSVALDYYRQYLVVGGMPLHIIVKNTGLTLQEVEAL